MLNGIEKAKTVTFNNDLNPVWDEVLYIPVHTPREKLTLEVMDFETLGKDRTLGYYELPLTDLIKEGVNGELLEHTEKKDRSEKLKLGKKGETSARLNFTVAFYPCLNVMDPEEEAAEKKEAEEKAKAAALAPPESPKAEELEAAKTEKVPGAPVAGEAVAEKEVKKEEKKKAEKIKMTPEELFAKSKYQPLMVSARGF